MSSEGHLEQLRAEARYRRERLALYRAKAAGPRATRPARLAELVREYELSASALERAERAAPPGPAAQATSRSRPVSTS
jgi:hypothetical protein